MTSDDVLRSILAAADSDARVFDCVEVDGWPPGLLDEFTRLNLIWRAAGWLYAPCPNCEGRHVEPVTVQVRPDGTKQFYIRCPESLRAEVTPEMCNGWQVDHAGMAVAVAAALGIRGHPRPVLADRLWRLGRVAWPAGDGGTREVLLARRMHDGDAATVAAHVGPCGRAIVLVPHHRPDERIWSGSVPAVVALSQITSYDDSGLVIDAEAVVDAVRTSEYLAKSMATLSLGPGSKKMVRRQVKAEIKSLLTDDAYVAAYKEHGSYRKAAEALAAQTGQKIGKDKVRRAVERHGGLAEIIPDADSASVARSVASQRRDRSRKFLQRR